MKKYLKIIATVGIAAAALTSCATTNVAENADGSLSVNGTYTLHVGAFDWGPAVDSATITLTAPLDSVKAEDFAVTSTKQAVDWKSKDLPVNIQNFDRTVTEAYLSDVNGQKVNKASKYVTLKLACSPTEGSPFLYLVNIGGKNVWSNPYKLNISLSDKASVTSKSKAVSSITIDPVYTAKISAGDVYSKDVYKTSNGETYKYAYYTPKEKSDTLVIWLHGAGEGGAPEKYISDMDITTLGNEVTVLAGKDFQDAIGGANVVAPQCPTMWMDDGSGKYTTDGTSKYTESLKEFIDFYVKKCGAKKIILTGCSNGGYMTMNMIMKYPDYFTAAVPCCEAYYDNCITDDMLKNLAKVPVYFIYSTDDPVVKPETCEIPTIERLKKMGATKFVVSTTDQVVDKSGLYKMPDGSPYKYLGHWSWIYFFNNESVSNDTKESSWNWIADQLK